MACNEDGGIENDLTVWCIDKDKYIIIGATDVQNLLYDQLIKINYE